MDGAAFYAPDPFKRGATLPEGHPAGVPTDSDVQWSTGSVSVITGMFPDFAMGDRRRCVTRLFACPDATPRQPPEFVNPSQKQG